MIGRSNISTRQDLIQMATDRLAPHSELGVISETGFVF